mmetsp:Transcript_34482/g.88212  ORF Transcript_34482/g.88212 Transcript_34482/m.88212 type:complete len:222 (+) Transcript_34482:323-988(+)
MRLLVLSQDVVAVHDGGKLGGLALAAAGEAVHRGVEVGLKEERRRVALPAGCVDHPVQCRLVAPVCPAVQHVADVDDKDAAGLRRNIHPGALVEDLQPWALVRQQEGEHPVVGVRPRSENAVLHARHLRRVVQRPQDGQRVVKLVVEPGAREVEAERQQVQHPVPQLGDLLDVLRHHRPVLRQRLRIRPAVGAVQRGGRLLCVRTRRRLGPDVEALFRVAY